MTLLKSRSILAVLVLTALALVVPRSAEAQRRGRQVTSPDMPWSSVAAGVRFGYDDDSSGEMLGSFLRIPLLRNGRVELLPSGDVTFLSGLREYQTNVDIAFVPRGRDGGLYVGGGLGWKNTIFDFTPGADRETQRGYNVLAGVKGPSAAAYSFQIELRWTFVADTDFDPRVVTIGVSIPLTNRGQGQR